jgi:hypothetical protein
MFRENPENPSRIPWPAIVRYYLTLTGLFVASRVWLFSQGLKPRFYHLATHWQTLDLNLLRGDLLQSLYYLHAQPPMWNGLVGLLLKAGDTPFKVLAIYAAMSWTWSLLITWMIFFVVRRITESAAISAGAAAFYVLCSSAYFYENYVHYPLFTAFLATGCALAVCLTFTAGGRAVRQSAFFAMLMVLLLSLSLTWAPFHPVVVIGVGGIVLLRLWKQGRASLRGSPIGLSLGTYILASLLAFVVPLKNMVIFGSFGTSSWAGMNLMGAVPRGMVPGEIREGCGFTAITDEEVKEASGAVTAEAAAHPASGARFKNDGAIPNFNNIGYLARSARCLAVARAAIRDHPIAFAADRLGRLVVTSTLLSDDYFITPAGMEPGSRLRSLMDARNLIYLPVFQQETRRFVDAYERGSRHYLVPVVVLAATLLLPLHLLRGRRALPTGYPEVLLISTFLTAWVLLVGHLGNATEQERFRFTVEPLLILVVSNAVKAHLWPCGRGGTRTARGEPQAE